MTRSHHIPTKRFPRAATATVIALVVAAFLAAAMLSGCADSPGTMVLTDDNGCKWTVPIYKHETRDRYGEPVAVVGPDGKQICR